MMEREKQEEKVNEGMRKLSRESDEVREGHEEVLIEPKSYLEY